MRTTLTSHTHLLFSVKPYNEKSLPHKDNTLISKNKKIKNSNEGWVEAIHPFGEGWPPTL